MLFLFQQIKQTRSKAANLTRSLGGKWEYDGRTTWWCDDDIRHVSRVSAGVDEHDNDIGPPQYWLYEKDKPPVRAEYFLLGRKYDDEREL